MITESIRSYSLFIQGFRNTQLISSESILQELRASVDGVDLQVLRADRIACKEHIIFAARNAVDSFGGKDRRAKQLSMELLLFASGEHQIVEAVKLLGVGSWSTEVVVVGLSETALDPDVLSSKVARIIKGVPDDTVLHLESLLKVEAMKEAYNISDRELNSSRSPGEDERDALKRLVIERSALLALEN